MKRWMTGTIVGVEVVVALAGWFLADIVVGPISRVGRCNVASTAEACRVAYNNFQTVGFILVFIALLALIGTLVVLMQERRETPE